MEYERERYFVQNFIKKERRERLMLELTDPARQLAGIDRFSHHAEELLDPKKIAMQGEDLDRRPEFWRFAESHDEMCTVLSIDFYMDEYLLPLGTAVVLAAESPEASVILGSSFAVVFGEAMKGGRGKYLLTADPSAAENGGCGRKSVIE